MMTKVSGRTEEERPLSGHQHGVLFCPVGTYEFPSPRGVPARVIIAATSPSPLQPDRSTEPACLDAHKTN